MGAIQRYGGPILYLFISIFALFGALIWAESGSRTARRLRDIRQLKNEGQKSSKEDVLAAAEHAEKSDDLLRVLDVSKTYGDNKVVDDVSFSLPRNTVFALLGPNGAGKTTTFNMIRKFPIVSSDDHLILTYLSQ
jgi:ATPase subunit of ABC transporter with duplicated ATPase domains